MEDRINKLRFDGKRWWQKDAHDTWWQSNANNVACTLRVQYGVWRKDIKAVLQNLKVQSQTVVDPVWLKEVAWRQFTKGCLLRLVFGKVEFYNPWLRRPTRSMTVEKFNRVVKARFPDRKQGIYDCPIVMIFP